MVSNTLPPLPTDFGGGAGGDVAGPGGCGGGAEALGLGHPSGRYAQGLTKGEECNLGFCQVCLCSVSNTLPPLPTDFVAAIALSLHLVPSF